MPSTDRNATGDRLERATTAAGVAAPALALGTVAVAAAASPTFAWPAEPFSVLGRAGAPTATGFNAGLFVTGLLAVAFAVRLRAAAGAVVGGLYAVVGVSFAGAALFPIGTPLHDVAAGIFLGIWLLLWAAGVRDWRAGDRLAGAATVALGTVVPVAWDVWPLLVGDPGLAAQELASLLAWAAWSVRSAAGLWRGDGGAG